MNMLIRICPNKYVERERGKKQQHSLINKDNVPLMTVLTLLANKWLGPENERSSEWEEVRRWWPLLSEGEAFCPRRAEKVIEDGHAENNADSAVPWERDKQAG